MKALGFAACMVLLAGCGGSYPGAPAEMTAAAPGGASGPTVAMSDEEAARVAASAPAPGQLTAGVWDDNLNFDFFKSYASRMSQEDKDLGAFVPAEQLAARTAFAGAKAHHELDVQLVIDTTGSMGDELQYLQSEFDSIVAQVKTKFPNVVPRWSFVVYRDHGDEYLTKEFGFTTDTAEFRGELKKEYANGGGDFPEAVLEGLGEGLDQAWRDSDANVAKVIFWVADAPPHEGEGEDYADVVRKARDMGVHVYPIASSGIDDSTEYQMRAAAQLTGGRYIFLTNDSGIGNDHAEPHIPCYQVTRLDQAVVRVIEVELTGKRVAAASNEIVRSVGSPSVEGKCAVGMQMVAAF